MSKCLQISNVPASYTITGHQVKWQCPNVNQKFLKTAVSGYVHESGAKIPEPLLKQTAEISYFNMRTTVIAERKREKTSTHKSAMTHSGNVFCNSNFRHLTF